MAGRKRKTSQKAIWIGSAAVIVVFVVISALLVKLLLTDTVQKKKRQTHQVKLLKPPKPPEVKKKPPPPKKEKKEVKQKVKKKKPKPKEQKSQKKPPQSENLGVDAKGEAGGDAFGLEAKEGGSPIIGGGGGGSLMQKFGWYNQLVEKVIRKRMDEIFEEQGGMPRGDLRTVVDVFLDDQGRIVRFEIHEPSGNERMDKTVKKALQAARIEKQPPEEMPKGMRLTIASKG